MFGGTIRYSYERELNLIQAQQNMFGGSIRYSYERVFFLLLFLANLS